MSDLDTPDDESRLPLGRFAAGRIQNERSTSCLTLRCPYCASDRLIRYGVTAKGQQRYRCRACGRQHRENPGSNAYSDAERETILRAYQERSSLRGLSRTFGVSRNTVTAWLKKKP